MCEALLVGTLLPQSSGRAGFGRGLSGTARVGTLLSHEPGRFGLGTFSGATLRRALRKVGAGLLQVDPWSLPFFELFFLGVGGISRRTVPVSTINTRRRRRL